MNFHKNIEIVELVIKINCMHLKGNIFDYLYQSAIFKYFIIIFSLFNKIFA